MTRLIWVLVPALMLAQPVMGQHHHHSDAPPALPKAPATPAKTENDPHAGHSQPVAQTLSPDHSAHAGHAGHQPDPHASHDLTPKAPAPRLAAAGPVHAADLIFDPAEMARARHILRTENGDMGFTAFKIDRLEARLSDGSGGYGWEVDGFSGGDINRFWWKSDGEGELGGNLHQASVQALYSRAVAPFWDVQTGVKQDYRREGPDRTHVTLGLQGTAPYWFEVSAAAFVSNKGDLTAVAEAVYDLRLTQKWILQPVAHVAVSAQDVPELGLASGLTSVSAGVLLRYEIKRELAPYVGVEWEGALGQTADLIRARGSEAKETRVVVGLKAWF